jgi:simple sugar transport system ATP-binding protein
MEKPLVELKNIVKTFGNVCALDGVDFSINKAEIIGLVGDNGAGKSTLIKIISGVHSPDSGEIYVRGEKMNRWSVARAREAGIETVYQDRALVVQQTIARNIFMGREIKGFLGFTRVKEQFAEADRLMRGSVLFRFHCRHLIRWRNARGGYCQSVVFPVRDYHFGRTDDGFVTD